MTILPDGVTKEGLVVCSVGILMLRVEAVKKGHEGVYKCYSLDQSNELKYNTVEVRVIERGR